MKYFIYALLVLFTLNSCNKKDSYFNDGHKVKYDPDIDPSNFTKSTTVTNIYFPIAEGKKYIYEGETEEGLERVEETRLEETKVIMGITCIVVNFKAYVDGNLIEEAWDWYAQENDGTLWYFGEAVDNYDEDGNLADHEGSWEAGVDGALPGIIMLADPRRGRKYREEFYEGEAEDEAQVIATGKTITIGYGTFTDCIVTRNWTRLEPGVIERKIYAPGIGLIKELNIRGGESLELIAIE